MIARSATSPAVAAVRAVLRPAAVLVATSAVALNATALSAYASAAGLAPPDGNSWTPHPFARHAIHGRPHVLRNGGGGHRPRHKAATHHRTVHSHHSKAASRATIRIGRHDATLPLFPSGGDPAALAVRDALAQLGKPYVYGKTGPWAFDCSGLTQHAWQAAGVHIPRTSEQQAEFGHPVDVRRIRPGDVVIYYPHRSHAAIYVGSGQIVYAPHTGSFVRLGGLYSMPVNVVRRP